MRIKGRKNRRLRRRSSRGGLSKKTVAWTLGLLAVTAAATLAARIGWREMRRHPHFVVRSVDIVGAGKLVGGDVRALVDPAIGSNTWELDLQRMQDRIALHPWVERVRIRRRLPDALVIAISERQPFAVVEAGTTRYAVDRRGQVIAPLPADAPVPAPRITGASALSAGLDSPRARAALRHAATLIRVLHPRRRVETVRVDSEIGLTVEAESPSDVSIHFGWGHWRQKRRRLNVVLRRWVGREERLRSIDLAFGDDVIVELRHPGADEAV